MVKYNFFPAVYRWARDTKARIPIIRDVHLNFILLHYTYIIAMAIITSIIIYPGNDLAYIDALFFCAGAATQSGLNTVDLNLLHTYQQVILYFTSMVTTPIFIHTVLVFVRLYWFEKRFQHVVSDARAFRRTRSRVRTMTGDKDNQTYDREEAGVRNRPVTVLRNVPEDSRESDHDGHSFKSPDDSDSASGSRDDAESPSEEPNRHIQRKMGLGMNSLRVPARLSPEHHIAFLENQRRDTGALRIPSPREYDRGGVPQALDEAVHGPPLQRTSSGQSTRSPRDMRDDSSDEDEEALENEDDVGPMDGPHITINEPEMMRSRTRNSTFPRLDTRPTVRETTDRNDGNDGNEPSSPIARTTTRRPTVSGIFRSLTQEKDRSTQPYLSWNATVARNSNFVDLTEEQRDELGGIEYRALKTLAVILMSYYVCFHLLGIVCLVPWILTTHWGQAVEIIGQGRPWWAIFMSGSAFNDVGFSITPDSMISFQSAIFPLLLMTFLIIIGNTGFPCMLRLIIWVMGKFTPQASPLWEELHFLLDHPRRCFTLLFPRNATWWLFAILVALNGIDLIFFIILDLNDVAVTALSTGIKIVDGLFQAACTRTAGFSVVSLSDLHPAVQVSYLIMMYISVFPIAISMRRTNVYEEKSLGIYGGPVDDDADPDAEETQTAPSYIGAHLRRQLSFDLWYVFLGLFIITIVEGNRIKREDQYSFQVWPVLFEIVSAYGTVGLSLGYPGTNTSFCGQFKVISKLVIIAMQVRGRHRGLPYSLDRAILLPSEHLNQKEVVDAERRMRRRASSLGQATTLDRQTSHSQGDNANVASGTDAKDQNEAYLRRQGTMRSQRSQR
ncbi:potassium transport protein TRK1/TRK2 [Aspergillus taichungensis]|uniref:Potassium transport protein n=1 Tax=Aspergillus taichungensis TaxID=482145 RepID=A0A2J5I7H8_9EURO|nr:potassium transport protein TRK1/TRK2 [Aspergillus taichungensis]